MRLALLLILFIGGSGSCTHITMYVHIDEVRAALTMSEKQADKLTSEVLNGSKATR